MNTTHPPTPVHDVILVGAGAVGRAIAAAHLVAGQGITLADRDETAIDDAIRGLSVDAASWTVARVELADSRLIAYRIERRGELLSSAATLPRVAGAAPVLLIESIAERLDVKQAFFRDAERWCGAGAILCSNTSTIRIESIADGLGDPSRFCGMHFFMPVSERNAVEIIRGPHTSLGTQTAAERHVRQLGKSPLVVADSPGFVVNRLLAPYLNQAMLLLSAGVSETQLERAARLYGMPMSPLELIDWIGTRTAFDAGRVYWQAFPGRLDPSPLIAAMVKQGRTGRLGGCGFYDYSDGRRSQSLSPRAKELAAKYCRGEQRDWDDESLVELLSIPMWIEAKWLIHDKVVAKMADIETAMSGGLGFQPAGCWGEHFERMTLDRIRAGVERWSAQFTSMRIDPTWISPLGR